MVLRAMTALGVLLVAAGCSTDNTANMTRENDEQIQPAVPAGGYVPPGNRPGYIDATDPNAFPPTPEQPAGME